MKKIKKIRSSLLTRQLSTFKLSATLAKDYFKNRKNENLKDKLKGTFGNNISTIVDELDLMKGSLMKMGQMLSLYGGSFLPAELQAILKKLENKSSYLEWEEIKQQIPKSWPNDKADLKIEETPLASASLGQVHLCSYKGERICMKIQYKGVRKAIDNDIKALKLLLKFFKFIPSELNLEQAFKEIKVMLLDETDYIKEAKTTREFSALLGGRSDYLIPEVIDELSNETILSTTFIDGVSLHNIEQLNLSQEERNTLGKSFMRLFFLELFVFEKVQTDAHFGNYLLTKNKESNKYIWGLIDFGATKNPSKKFIKGYQSLILSLRNQNRKEFISIVMEMGYLSKNKDSDLDIFWEYAQLISGPFTSEVYNWGNVDIADKVFDFIPKLAKSVSIGSPPPESIFIDRKLGGVFFILQKLKAQFSVVDLLDSVIKEQKVTY